MDDAEWVIQALTIGTISGLVVFMFCELANRDSTVGKFWEAFKDEQG